MDKTAEINSRLLALEKQFPNDLNVAALKIYVDFCLKNHDTKIAVAEKHHILTRASFPAFAKEPTILVRLSPASHLKAHYLLVLALPSNLKALYAFNLMINTRGARAKTAGLYSDDEIQKFAAQYEATKLRLLPHLRQTGRIRGNSNVKSEWWLALGRREGRRAVESGRLKCMRTPENCAKGGRVSGRNHVESGTGIFGLSAEQTLQFPPKAVMRLLPRRKLIRDHTRGRRLPQFLLRIPLLLRSLAPRLWSCALTARSSRFWRSTSSTESNKPGETTRA